jgi:hypothetical protein
MMGLSAQKGGYMRTISLLGIAFALAACGHDGVGPSPTPTIPGKYDLTTVDGQGLPFTALDLGAYQAKLVSGTLSLSADGTYSFQFGIRIEDSGNVRTAADSDGGLWNVNDKAITLASTHGDIARTGTVSGNVMTLQSSSRVFGLTKNRR